MESFGKYKIEKQIGLGGTASVYLAIHTGLSRNVVLKVMSNELFSQDIDYKKLFVEEAQTIARLQHPNIIQVYDVNTEDGRIYIEMEYLSGGTLKDRIQESLPFDPIQVTLDIAAALQYVFNASGVIHRDIKPSNILFREEEDKLSAVLTDFGIAKSQNTDSEFTNIGVRVGTPRYMSPEQLMGGHIDQRSDLYSLGIILYELLSEQLFNKDQAPGVIESFSTPQLPSKHKKLQPILNKLVTPNPNDRFGSAGELMTALAKFSNYSPAKTSAKPRRKITSSDPKSKKIIIGASMLLGTLTLGGGGYAFYSIQEKTKNKEASIEKIEIAILSLQQNETTPASVFALIEASQSKYPKEQRLKELSDKANKLAQKHQRRLLIDNALQLVEKKEFGLAERQLSKVMGMSPSEIETDEVEQTLDNIQKQRIENTKRIEEENKLLAQEKQLSSLGTMIISSYGFTDKAPILSKIKSIKKIDSWPKVRVSNSKPLFIQCLYQSPNNEIYRLHPYPRPNTQYSSSPQQPGVVIDIPLGEEAPGTAVITCIGSKKNMKNEFMNLFNSQYKLSRLSSVEEVSKYLKEESNNIAIIESTEVIFK